MTPTDQAFLTAITTIKSLSKGPNALRKPTPERKVRLYGLYKQSTEGDVEGIMPRPVGSDPQSRANQQKWDAWKSHEGLPKQDAKLRYVEYLLDTIRVSFAGRDPAPLTQLEEALRAAKESQPVSPAVASPRAPAAPPTNRQAEPRRSRRLSAGSINSSYSHFLRHPIGQTPSVRHSTAFSEFGLSDKDRSELQADQIVDQLQSAYPPIIPGAVVPSPWPADHMRERMPSDLPVLSSTSQYPYLSRGTGAAAPPPPPPKKPGIGAGLQLLWTAVQSWTSKALERLLKMIIADATKVVVVLVLIRIVALRPELLQRLPILRRTAQTLCRVLVVFLNGFDIELRFKSPQNRLPWQP